MATVYEFGTETTVLQTMNENLPTHRSWTKGALVSPSGRRCMFGSVVGDNNSAFVQLLSHPVSDLLFDVIKEQYPDRISKRRKGLTSGDHVMNFNDHAKTSFDDVKRVIEKGLAKASESL